MVTRTEFHTGVSKTSISRCINIAPIAGKLVHRTESEVEVLTRGKLRRQAHCLKGLADISPLAAVNTRYPVIPIEGAGERWI